MRERERERKRERETEREREREREIQKCVRVNNRKRDVSEETESRKMEVIMRGPVEYTERMAG